MKKNTGMYGRLEVPWRGKMNKTKPVVIALLFPYKSAKLLK